MPLDDTVRLWHMLEAAQKAVAFTRGKCRSDLDRDEVLCLALVRLIEIVGEAARSVTPDRKRFFPPFPGRRSMPHATG